MAEIPSFDSVVDEFMRAAREMESHGYNVGGCSLRAADAMLNYDFMHIISCMACQNTINAALMVLAALYKRDGLATIDTLMREYGHSIESHTAMGGERSVMAKARDIFGETRVNWN